MHPPVRALVPILALAAGCTASLELGLPGRGPADRRPASYVAAAEMAGAAEGDAAERDVARTCESLTSGRVHPAGMEVHAALDRMLGCGHGPMWPGDRLPEDTTSTVASAGWVGGCLAVRHDDLPDVELRLPYFAVCGVEGRAISPDAFAAELERLHLARGAKARALRYLGQLQATLAAFDEHLAPKIAADPALKEVFYGAPEAALKDGRLNRTRGARQRAAVAAFEAELAHGRAAVAGCAVELRDALVERMRSHRVATIERALLGSRDAIGQPVARALAACAAIDGEPAIAAAARDVLGEASDHEGVRTLIYWYVHDAVRALRKDRGDFWFAERDLPRPPTTRYPTFDTEPFDDYLLRAPIETIARTSAGVRVSFGEVRWKELERECTRTDEVQSIDVGGGVRYRRACKDLGVRQKRATEPAVVVAAEHAGGLAAGRTVEMRCERRGEPKRCVPVFVWSDATRTKLVGFLGAAL